MLLSEAPQIGRIHRWPSAVAVPIVMALLAPLVLYAPTAWSMVRTWNSADTFAHGYVIVPISAWLIWRRRAVFEVLAPVPWPPALALLMLAGVLWLLAHLGQVQVVMQYAFAALFPLAALALLGRQLAGTLAFPLLFLLLAVPFGDIFIAPLIEFTADFTVWGLQLTGIPVLRDGTRFELPTGHWSVVEACSGVRYLISSFTIGCLYAYLTYRSALRRGLFVLMSILVPILANGVRAYSIVLIGHTSDMALASGVDHLIYGWLFFGLVMLAMFWAGNVWHEDAQPQSLPHADGTGDADPLAIRRVAIAVVAVCALWPVLAACSDRAAFNRAPPVLGPVASGWDRASPFTTWTPGFAQADATFKAFYRWRDLAPVALTILYYRNQTGEKSLLSSTNRLVHEKDPYHQRDSEMRTESAGGRHMTLRESAIEGPDGQLLVWHWNWVDGQPVSNAYVGKVLQVRARLHFRGDDGAAIMLSAPYTEQDRQAARAALRAFLDAHLHALDAALVSTRSR